MSKQQGETDLHYRQRVLDPKSSSFCGAKWYNATIWIANGHTTSCHHPFPHPIPLESVLQNPKGLHNTQVKKDERRMMQSGERPKGCEYCWKIEDMGRESVSDRVYKSMIYSEEDLERARHLDWRSDVDLQTLEISFDRVCNFACSYCHPGASTSWVKDIRKNGPYQGLATDPEQRFERLHDYAEVFQPGEPNPYAQAFFQWWESDLHRTLQELRLTGGEPLMSPELWRLLDWFLENRGRSTTRLAINSNLGAKQELIDKLVDKSQQIENLHIYTSCEALGEQAEYIRDGMDFAVWDRNVRRLLRETKIEALHMMCTINALCLPNLSRFLDYCLELKREFGPQHGFFTLNILRFPAFQSVAMLPRSLRQEARSRLGEWHLAHRSDPLVSQMESNHLQRLIDYLDVVVSPHEAASDRDALELDFQRFITQYDRRRGKDFRRTFPELRSWFDGISAPRRARARRVSKRALPIIRW